MNISETPQKKQETLLQNYLPSILNPFNSFQQDIQLLSDSVLKLTPSDDIAALSC